MPVIPVVGRQKQEYCPKFEASLSYTVSFRSCWTKRESRNPNDKQRQEEFTLYSLSELLKHPLTDAATLRTPQSACGSQTVLCCTTVLRNSRASPVPHFQSCGHTVVGHPMCKKHPAQTAAFPVSHLCPFLPLTALSLVPGDF